MSTPTTSKPSNDPMVAAFATITSDEARAVWTAIAQFIDNSDPEECGEFSEPFRDAAISLMAKLDAGMIEIGNRAEARAQTTELPSLDGWINLS